MGFLRLYEFRTIDFMRLLGFILLLTLARIAPVRAGNWPGFRGADANGVAERETVPTAFGPSSNLLWKAEVPSGHSSPVIWAENVFLTGADSNRLVTTCLDRSSGKVIWERVVTAPKLEKVHKVNTRASSTPATDGKGVYVYFGSFGVLAYDLGGKELWKKPLPMPQTFFNQGTGTSPILADGKLLVFVQIGNDSHLLALNPADGREVWRAPVPIYNNTYSTPVLWKEGDTSRVGLMCAGRFTAFNLADGKEAWWVDGVGYQACSTPVAAGDRLVIAAAGVQGELSNMTPPPAFEEMLKKFDGDKDGLLAYEEIPGDFLFTDRQAADGKGNMSLRQALGMFGGVKRGDKLSQQKYQEIRERLDGFRLSDMNRTVVLAVRTGGKQDATKSHVIWKETKGVPEVPSPLVWQERVYLIRSGGLLVCRDLESGKLIYENRIDSPGGYFASPVLAGDRLYLASDRGTVTVIRAGDAFEVLARNEFDEPILASPAVGQGTLFLRSTGHLWAVGVKPN